MRSETRCCAFVEYAAYVYLRFAQESINSIIIKTKRTEYCGRPGRHVNSRDIVERRERNRYGVANEYSGKIMIFMYVYGKSLLIALGRRSPWFSDAEIKYIIR